MIPYCILVIEDESDRAFMESLYHNYRRLMYKTIKRIIDDPWSAEDVMQSVLVKLIDKLALLRSKEEQQVVSYIVSACRNTAYNYVRDQRDTYGHGTGREKQTVRRENHSVCG